MIADLARENGQLQAENAELKKELARLGSAPDASAVAAAG
jgi:cell division septum initiation protein DivIVA